MSTIAATWIAGNGSWFTAGNWQEPNPNAPPPYLHYVPNSGNDVSVSNTAQTTLTIAYNGTDTVNTISSTGAVALSMTGGLLGLANSSFFDEIDLASAATLSISANATLSLSAGSFTGTTSGAGTLRFVNGTFNIYAGTVMNVATWLLDYQTGSNTVSNTVLQANLTYANTLILQSPYGDAPFLDLNGYVFTLSGTSSLNGNIDGTGTVKITGVSTVDDASFGNDASAGYAAANAITFENAGSVSQYGFINLNGTILNDSGHSWTIMGPSQVTDHGATFTNNGTLSDTTTSGNGEFDGTFNNNGTMSIASGALIILASGTETVAGTVSGSGTLDFGYAHNATLVTSALTVSTIIINGGNGGGTVTLGESLSYAGAFDFVDQFGSLNTNDQTLTLSGASMFSSGGIYGNGKVKITGTATFGYTGLGNGPGGYTAANASTFENAGTVTVTAGFYLNGVILNDSGATWIFANPSAIGSAGSSSFTNNGTISDVATGGSSEIDGIFASPGTISVGTGSVMTVSGGVENISGTVSGAGTLNFGYAHRANLNTSSLTIAAITVNGGNGGGTLKLGENLTYAGTFTFADGFGYFIAAGYTLTLSGVSSFIGGNQDGPGAIKITGSATVGGVSLGYDPSNGYASANAILFENANAVLQNGNINLNGTIQNDSGATWSLTAGSIYNDGAIFANYGALNDTSANSEMDGTFRNVGAVSIAGGTLTLRGAVFNDTVVAVNSGRLVVAGALAADSGYIGTTTIGANTVAEFTGSVAATQAVVFVATPGILQIDSLGSFNGSVGGFQAGDTIYVANTTVTLATYQATGSGVGTLTLYNGATQVGAINLAGTYTGDHFAIRADASGNGYDIRIGAPDDFNGDGKGDLLEQNVSGAAVIYTMNGLSVAGATSIGNPGSTWHVMGSADFNGDGQADILLQNDNGSIVDYLMNGTTYVAGYDLANLASSWHVRGTGDFNGDGNADILVQNDNGAMVLLETNGTSVIAAPSVGTLPSGWQVEGVADFNGDGQPDILVQSTGGALIDYTMNGATIASGAVIANVGAGWSVGGTGDYNGDGKADILLHNDNGSDVVLEMNGATATAAVAIGNPGAGYNTTVAGIDLNGDGNPDLVVGNSATSTLIGYTLNNTATITAGTVLGTPGAGWNVVGSNPTTFIDGTGSTLALADTAGPDQFNLTSYMAGIHTITGFDPAKDTLALNAGAFPTYATVQANEAAYQGGTFVGLSSTAAIIIQGVAPGQLSSSNFVLR
jgi:hypothetical protein